MGPRHDEKLARPREVWKYDIHTSDYMRNGLGMTMEAEHGATAMVFWLEALHDHLRTKLILELTTTACDLPTAYSPGYK